MISMKSQSILFHGKPPVFARAWRLLFCGRSLRSLLPILAAAFLLGYSGMGCAGSHALASDNPSGNVVATVNGKTITEEELEAPFSTRIYQMRMEIYQMKRQYLTELIAEMILHKEADERKMPLETFVKEVVLAGESAVGEEEIQQYLRANPDIQKSWQGSREDLNTQVRAQLKNQKDYRRLMEYANKVKSKSTVSVQFKEPPLPRVNVEPGDSPAMGPADAPLTIIEFSDYRCPSCRQVHATVKQLREAYKGKIRWVFKDFPLGGNEVSIKAAQAARCAGEQMVYWQYQDLLFNSKEEPTPDNLRAIARSLNLKMDKFNACMDSGKYIDQVMRDAQEGNRIGIDRTPSFTFNGKLFPGGPTMERFKEIIEEELKSAAGRKG